MIRLKKDVNGYNCFAYVRNQIDGTKNIFADVIDRRFDGFP
jgi:hypothetical protein